MHFNAYEILEMAEQIERNGTAFYRHAAECVDHPEGKKLLLDLADWEIGHEKTFAKMKQALSQKESDDVVFDPEGEASLYIKAYSEGHVFNLDQDPASALKGKTNLRDILLEAINREKDAIVFFTGFLDLVPPSLGKERVEAIIKEEIGHIGQLSAQLSALSD